MLETGRLDVGHTMIDRRVARQAAARENTPFKTLLKELGSAQGADPLPPSQYLFFLDPTQPAQQRLLAWVRSKTIRFRPQDDGSDGRSAFAVNDKGKTLGIADMARELGWKLPNASREWSMAEKVGLVRREGKKLYLNGNVPRLQKGKTGRNVICTDNLPKSIRKVIEGWPEARRLEFYAVWEPARKLDHALQAHQIAKARMSATEVYDTILDQFGLARKHPPKPAEFAPPTVPEQLSLFIQMQPDGGVQITIPRGGTDNKIAVSTDNPILMPTEKSHRGMGSVVVTSPTATLGKLLELDDDAAKRLWTECSRKEPTITPSQIVYLAAMKQRQLKGKESNRVGLLLTAVPRMCAGATLETARSEVKKQEAIIARAEEEYRRMVATGDLPDEI